MGSDLPPATLIAVGLPRQPAGVGRARPAANQPIESMCKFVDDFVADGDTLLERNARGEAINITMEVVLEVEDGLMDRCLDELRRAIEEE